MALPTNCGNWVSGEKVSRGFLSSSPLVTVQSRCWSWFWLLFSPRWPAACLSGKRPRWVTVTVVVSDWVTCVRLFTVFLKYSWLAGLCQVLPCSKVTQTPIRRHPLPHTLFHRVLSRETGCSSLCRTVGPHCVSLLLKMLIKKFIRALQLPEYDSKTEIDVSNSYFLGFSVVAFF